MFYCNVCAEKNQWPTTCFKIRGTCEICESVGVCNALPSNLLPPIAMGEPRPHPGDTGAGTLGERMMVLHEEEAIDLIRILITKYAPPGLDKNNALDKLDQVGQSLLLVPTGPCPKCKSEMICLRCNEIEVEVVCTRDITVRAGRKIIYED